MLFKHRNKLLLCLFMGMVQTVLMDAAFRQAAQRFGQAARGGYSAANPSWRDAVEKAGLEREIAAEQLALRRKEAEKTGESLRERAELLRERAANAEKVTLWERQAGITNANRFEGVGASTREQMSMLLGQTRPMQWWQNSATRQALQNGRQRVAQSQGWQNAKQGLQQAKGKAAQGWQTTKASVGRARDRVFDRIYEYSSSELLGAGVVGGVVAQEAYDYLNKEKLPYAIEYNRVAEAGDVRGILDKIEDDNSYVYRTSIENRVDYHHNPTLKDIQWQYCFTYLSKFENYINKTPAQIADDLVDRCTFPINIAERVAEEVYEALNEKMPYYGCTPRDLYWTQQKALEKARKISERNK